MKCRLQCYCRRYKHYYYYPCIDPGQLGLSGEAHWGYNSSSYASYLGQTAAAAAGGGGFNSGYGTTTAAGGESTAASVATEGGDDGQQQQPQQHQQQDAHIPTGRKSEIRYSVRLQHFIELGNLALSPDNWGASGCLRVPPRVTTEGQQT